LLTNRGPRRRRSRARQRVRRWRCRRGRGRLRRRHRHRRAGRRLRAGPRGTPATCPGDRITPTLGPRHPRPPKTQNPNGTTAQW